MQPTSNAATQDEAAANDSSNQQNRGAIAAMGSPDGAAHSTIRAELIHKIVPGNWLTKHGPSPLHLRTVRLPQSGVTFLGGVNP